MHTRAHVVVFRLFPSLCVQRTARMITDTQLASFVNLLGVMVFLLIVVYHYVAVNQPVKRRLQ